MAADNISLGTFMLTGIPPAPRGMPQIEVTFDIDANGILSVSAQDKATGKKQSITITASNKLSKSEVEKMVKQAEEFADQDKAKQTMVQERNQAESLTYEAEHLLKELGDKVTSEERTEITQKVEALRKELSAKEPSLKPKVEELLAAMHKLSARLYQTGGADAGTTTNAGSAEPTSPPEEEKPDETSSSDKGPMDADFKVVNDK